MHSAFNRNEYVEIVWDNIREEFERNFQTFPTSHFGEDYDYTSVMHYNSKAFSSNGEPTLVPLVSLLDISIHIWSLIQTFF